MRESMPSTFKAIGRHLLAGIILTMTIMPAAAGSMGLTGSVGLVSADAFAEQDDFSRADVVAWEAIGLSRADCLARATALQHRGQPAICFFY